MLDQSPKVQLKNPYEIFADMTDEEIATDVKLHNNLMAQDYLLQKYRNFVRAKARSYFLIGAEKEDIIQEGMIGLYKAIRDFRNDKLASFRAFAELCITRQIITAIKTATRQKHIPLNSYVSLNKPIYEEDSDRTLLDVISGVKVINPEDMVISKEEFIDIEKEMNNILSELEWEVLRRYLDGKSYQEIAEELRRHIKSIDNALQRVKRKLEKFLSSREDTTDLRNVYNGLIAMNPKERFSHSLAKTEKN
ncbi:MAG: RNA polymerase sporulation sigma factor SigH [Acidaminococcaceae bacterium]|nr:RNA polymerase sporulation sigma factor SigH [Acidaminococcaceae bacterium]